jgi:hypothetical protein
MIINDIITVIVSLVIGVLFYFSACSYGEEEMHWGIKRPQKDKEE